jgi:UDP-glucose 4-epimerase
MKKVLLITGSEGFIGRNFLEQELKNFSQYEVHTVDIQEESVYRSEVTHHKIGIETSEMYKLILQIAPAIILHLAAQTNVRLSIANPENDYLINFIGTSNIVDALAELENGHIVFANSGGAIFGEQQNGAANENDKLEPLSPYGQNKKLAYEYMLEHLKGTKITFASLNLSNVYGLEIPPKSAPAIFANQALRSETIRIFGDGYSIRDWVHVSDVCHAFTETMKMKENLFLNISSGIGTSINELLSGIEAILNKPIRREYLDGVIGEVKRSVLDNQKAMKTLSWRPKISLKEGIEQIISGK